MITAPARALGDLAMKLAVSVAPETTSAYVMANAGMIAVLLQAIGQDSERAVANRLEDVEEIKALFTLFAPDFSAMTGIPLVSIPTTLFMIPTTNWR